MQQANDPSSAISVNALSQGLLQQLCDQANSLALRVRRCPETQVRLVDAGINVSGSLEAGRRIAEICMGGLGQVQFSHNMVCAQWPLSVQVHAVQPVLACLASQYAGWRLAHGEGKDAFYALGSGPARALALKEPLFNDLDYQDDGDCSVLVLEVDKPPPAEVIRYVAQACGLAAEQLTVILTPTRSLAGVTQVVARVLEVALHKAHTLKFPLADIVDGYGHAPLPPPAKDFMTAMGRTNDAILFAGYVQLFVQGEASAAQDLARQLPSNTSSDYGQCFAEVFKQHHYDFFQIDPMLFSPACVAVTHMPSGQTWRAGTMSMPLLEQSFS